MMPRTSGRLGPGWRLEGRESLCTAVVVRRFPGLLLPSSLDLLFCVLPHLTLDTRRGHMSSGGTQACRVFSAWPWGSLGGTSGGPLRAWPACLWASWVCSCPVRTGPGPTLGWVALSPALWASAQHPETPGLGSATRRAQGLSSLLTVPPVPGACILHGKLHFCCCLQGDAGHLCWCHRHRPTPDLRSVLICGLHAHAGRP